MRVLITGVTGQDGSYLAESLLAAGHTVIGTGRAGEETSTPVGVDLRIVDFAQADALSALIRDVEPDQVYHLAGLSSVAASWADPVATMQINATASVALLDACWRRLDENGRQISFVQAASAEVFGQPEEAPQDESTPIRPVNPYGASKAAAHHAVGVFRRLGLAASSLILYNHESPRRPEDFVTRKITATVARIARGEDSQLVLGNLDARRDWGWAPDYCDAMRLAAEGEPGDYVIATGQSHSVRDFVAAAFSHAGLSDWEQFVVVDPAFFRPVDAFELVGDASKAHRVLGWSPSVSFEELVARMVDADLHG